MFYAVDVLTRLNGSRDAFPTSLPILNSAHAMMPSRKALLLATGLFVHSELTVNGLTVVVDNGRVALDAASAFKNLLGLD